MAQQFPDVRFPGWEIIRKLGEGSFGGVYEIHRTLPDGRVEKAALKKLTVPKDNSEIRELYSQSFSKENITAHYKDQMRELVNEYTLTQELNGCRNVVACHDVQCVQHTDGIGWDIYIRMELLKPLKHVLSADYQEMAVLKLGLSLCNALLACQEHHIVHRDIKPENILVSDRGEFKLGDFGIAKVSEKTATGTMTGTMGYMAPEVANRWHYGAQADIYSLGMVLYWMMNRRTLPFLPFPPTIPTAAQRQEAANRRFAGESFPPPINGSRELKAIVMKACAFSTDKRYQTVQELRRDLYACYQQRRAGKTPDVSIPADTDETVPTNEPTSSDTYSGNRSFHNTSQNEKTGTLNTDTAKAGTGRFTAPPEKKKSHKWVWIPVCILLLCGGALGIRQAMTAAYNAKQTAYLEAQRLLDEEEYSAAAEAFDALKGYDDSADKAQEARQLQEAAQDYQAAQQLMADGEYLAAAEAFDALEGYDDSADKAQEARQLQEMAQDYQAAQQLMDDGEYLAAAEAFDALEGFEDSANKAQEARHLQEAAQDYQAAQQLMDDGKYMQAMWAFSALDFRDSAEKAQEAKSKYIRNSNLPALAANYHIVGLHSDGTVVVSDVSSYDDCGQDDVDSWTDIVAVAAGSYHTVGLRSDGTVIATGINDNASSWKKKGQCDVESWTDIIAVAAQYRHTVGLHSDGTVIATGDNSYGQCDVDSWTDIVAVAAGSYHTVGLRSDGTVIATGINNLDCGQCDVDSWTDIVAVAAGSYHTVGLRSDGTVIATGINDGSIFDEGQCAVDSWTDIVAIAACSSNTVGLRSDGTVVTTASNYYGPRGVDSWTDIVAVAANHGNPIGLRSDGTVVTTSYQDLSDWKDIRLPQK
ncbi:MAG: protein kinase [Oscillospiraceae bacterium]